jgi:glycosyltransferase involved in cell wall biosynthesis
MKLLIADSRPRSSGKAVQDRHRDELILALQRSQPGWDLKLATPASGWQELARGEIYVDPWNLDGRQALAFVQRRLPRMARELSADVTLVLFAGAPLRSPVPIVSYLPASEARLDPSWLERMAVAAGRAGSGWVAGRVGYADMPVCSRPHKQFRALEPWVDPLFSVSPQPDDHRTLEALELQPGSALAFGFSSEQLPLLMAAWSWVAGSTGDAIPLVILGLEHEDEAFIQARARQLKFDNSIHMPSTPPLQQLAAMYRQAGLFIHDGASETGQALRWALATGRPIAAIEGAYSEAILGEAAYLTPAGDARRLGAAILSLLLDEILAAQLGAKAQARAERYHRPRPLDGLEKLLVDIAGKERQGNSGT